MIIFWLIGIFAIIIIATVLLNIFRNWEKLINYKNLFTSFVIGTILLSVLFIFVKVDILVMLFSYVLVIIFSLFYGAFKKSK